jgi:hypothetical protein
MVNNVLKKTLKDCKISNMHPLDTFFIDNLGPSKIDYDLLLPKDRKILVSFRSQLLQNIFFTERQAHLLVKILKDNKKVIKSQVNGIDTVIDNVSWSKDFRVIKKFREISVDNTEKPSISIRFNFDKAVKDRLYALSGKFIGNFLAISSTEFRVSFNEPNIMLLNSEFKEFNFEFDNKIKKIIEDIDVIVKNSKENFDILKTDNVRLLSAVKKDVGEINDEHLTLLHDRKFRYQYKISKEIEQNSLTTKIACRKSTKIFIDSQKYSLDQVISSLKELNRFPMLTVFEGHTVGTNKDSLDLLATALKNNNLDNDVGIYFRFDSEQDHAGFNKTVAQLEFNKNLNETTMVAGIPNNKLPKFMLKNPWRASTVLSFTTNFKTNKASVYASNADLIIYYSKTKPLGGNIHDIV